MNRVIDRDSGFKQKIGEIIDSINTMEKYSGRGSQLAIEDIVRILKLREGDFDILDNDIVVNWEYTPDRSHMPGNLNTHSYIKYRWMEEEQ